MTLPVVIIASFVFIVARESIMVMMMTVIRTVVSHIRIVVMIIPWVVIAIIPIRI